MNFIILEAKPSARTAAKDAGPRTETPRSPDLSRLKRTRPPVEAPSAGRRLASRKAVKLAADIAVDPSHWLTCTVRDMSATGAMLEVRAEDFPGYGRDLLPDRFHLVIDGHLERSLVECWVRWRKGDQVGVQFLGPIKTDAKPPPVRAPRLSRTAAAGRR